MAAAKTCFPVETMTKRDCMAPHPSSSEFPIKLAPDHTRFAGRITSQATNVSNRLHIWAAKLIEGRWRGVVGTAQPARARQRNKPRQASAWQCAPAGGFVNARALVYAYFRSGGRLGQLVPCGVPSQEHVQVVPSHREPSSFKATST